MWCIDVCSLQGGLLPKSTRLYESQNDERYADVLSLPRGNKFYRNVTDLDGAVAVSHLGDMTQPSGAGAVPGTHVVIVRSSLYRVMMNSELK